MPQGSTKLATFKGTNLWAEKESRKVNSYIGWSSTSVQKCNQLEANQPWCTGNTLADKSQC